MIWRMESLRRYLNALPREGQQDFAARVGTSLGYLRKAISARQSLGVELVSRIHHESGGAVPCEELRPDIDWDVLRRSLIPGDAA